jgi:hypothetical protein
MLEYIIRGGVKPAFGVLACKQFNTTLHCQRTCDSAKWALRTAGDRDSFPNGPERAVVHANPTPFACSTTSPAAKIGIAGKSIAYDCDGMKWSDQVVKSPLITYEDRTCRQADTANWLGAQAE